MREIKQLLEVFIFKDIWLVELNLGLVPFFTDPALVAVAPHLAVLHVVIVKEAGENDLFQESRHWIALGVTLKVIDKASNEASHLILFRYCTRVFGFVWIL